MKTLIKGSFLVAVVALWTGSAVPLSADTTIFDNSVNDLVTRFDTGTFEVGDQINLAGTERYLTHFDFEYWGVFTGPVEARVRFYENTGPLFNGYAAPSSTPFYDSLWFSGFSATPRATLNFDAGSDFASGGLFIPASQITWSVQFRYLGAGETAGVDLYSPPVVGSEVGDFGDYWQNDGTSWTLLTNSVAMDFGARMYATVPEPSSLVLSLFGGLGILTMLRRLRQSS